MQCSRLFQIGGVLAFSALSSIHSFPQSGMPRTAANVEKKNEASSEGITTRLPVTRVLLYKNGVGFFEHAGMVRGNQKVGIDFTSAQLNDVLQSLTAVDLNGGYIAGAGYRSTTPLEQQLQNLSLGLGAGATTDDFYQAIRGARIQVRDGAATVSGRLLNVEENSSKAVGGNQATAKRTRSLTMISDGGAAQTIELTSKTRVQLLDADVHQDATRYLQLLATTHTQGLRHLTLEADGTGTRQVRVSYIGEVPIWKATYRILFGAAIKNSGSATMQGWAIIDNTTGNDWENVHLSLIAGAPQSFIQPVSQPYYARRPEIGLPEEAQLTPQTHESGEMGGVASPRLAGTGHGEIGGILGGIGAESVGSMGVGAGGAMNGTNSNQTVTVNAAPAPAIPYEDSATASIAPKTNTSSFDDYFEYAITSPVTIRKNESALVPILQSKVEAQRVTLWSPSQPTALRALWLTNTSDLTLDRGSFSIVEDGKFGGEGLLDPIHPREKRLLSYAADQAVRVTVDNQFTSRRTQQIAVSKGILTEKIREIAEVEYIVHNAATDTRDVIVEQPRRQGWNIDSDLSPVETTATAYRFSVMSKAAESVHLHIGEYHTISERYELVNMNDQQLDYIVRSTDDNDQLRQQLTPVIEARRRLADLDTQIAVVAKSMDEIGNDQKRLRENLTALKGSSEERALVRRYTEELNSQEDRINALYKQQDSLKEQSGAAKKDLSDKIGALQMTQDVN